MGDERGHGPPNPVESIQSERNSIRRGSLEITIERARRLNMDKFYNGQLIRYNGWSKIFTLVRERNCAEALKFLSCMEPTEMLHGIPGPAVIAQIRKFLEQKVIVTNACYRLQFCKE